VQSLAQKSDSLWHKGSVGGNYAAGYYVPPARRNHIVKLHVDEKLLISQGSRPYIDPVLWRLLIMIFCRFFGLAVKYTRHGWRNRISGSSWARECLRVHQIRVLEN